MLAGLVDFFGNLGWALLHSLWQGTLAYLVVVGFRALSPVHASSARYLVQTVMLAACLMAFIVTFSVYQFSADQMGVESVFSPLGTTIGSADRFGGSAVSLVNDPGAGLEMLLSRYAPVMGALWCLGFSLLSVHYARRLSATQRLRTMGLSPVPIALARHLDLLRQKIGLHRTVSIYISNRVRGPLTLGALKPIILVPASFLTRLTQDEVEAILLHELAHIHRHDYLVNLVQTAIRSIFFYHPAISYISRKIDEDREFACDDFAVATTQNPVALARGLAHTRVALFEAQFALAADGKDTPLIGRLKRLTGQSVPRNDRGAFVIPLAAFGLIAFALMSVAGEQMTAQAATQIDHTNHDRQIDIKPTPIATQQATVRADHNRERASTDAGSNDERDDGFQAALIKQLIADGYIWSSVDDFEIKYSMNAMYVNGVKVPDRTKENYCELMSNAGLKKAQQSHIIMEKGGRSLSIHTHGK